MRSFILRYLILLMGVGLLQGCFPILVPRHGTPRHSAPRHEGRHHDGPHAAITPEVQEEIYVQAPVINLPMTLDSAWLMQEIFPADYENYSDQRLQEKVASFYALNGYKTKWLGQAQPFPIYYTLIDLVNHCYQYGLNPDDYAFPDLPSADFYTAAPTRTQIAAQDVAMTSVFFLLSTDLAGERIPHCSYEDKIWKRYPTTTVAASVLVNVQSPEDLSLCVSSMQPMMGQYTQLQKAMTYYHTLAQEHPKNTLPVITIDHTLAPGDVDDAVPAIRQRLLLTDLRGEDTGADTSRVYDAGMASAIRWFQHRHGLEVDGRIGKHTVTYLNLSFEEKADLIALNLERLRWLPRTTTERQIIVNIPDYSLRVYRHDTLDLKMRVIVGRERSATPVFTDTLRYIVFSPTWTVPHSIIKDEIIPRLSRDSSYYSTRGYKFYKDGQEVDATQVTWSAPDINPYAYQVVQQPGPSNALGLVKFIMPNSMSIYLHDTPSHYLFNRTRRAFSHGCIRVEDPAGLAAYLLKDIKGWDDTRIYDHMHGESPTTVWLKHPYQVTLLYLTSWVDEHGQVNFREDIYGFDKQQLTYLKQRPSPLAHGEKGYARL